MKIWIMLPLAATVWLPAFAATSYQAGSQTLHVNDAEGSLVEAMGQPTRKVSIDNSKGEHTGDYYYYVVDKKTIRFLVNRGRVQEIYEIGP
jgi:hypothetical protein